MTEENKSFKEGFIDRIRGLVNDEGHKMILIKEDYLMGQVVRFGEELCLEHQCYIVKVDSFDDIKLLDEKAMAEAGWVRKEADPPKIHLI